MKKKYKIKNGEQGGDKMKGDVTVDVKKMGVLRRIMKVKKAVKKTVGYINPRMRIKEKPTPIK